MTKYSVKKLAKISGVSVRTLHHYDQIGILNPSVRTEAGYRQYGEKELLRLQQILFYKEMDFTLKDIGEILDDPDFNLVEALENHKENLYGRKLRVEKLLATIEKTIKKLKNGGIMKKPEELYEGLGSETALKYRDEAIQRYGEKSVENSETALLRMGKEGFQLLQQEMKVTFEKLFAMRNRKASDVEVQQLIAQHYTITRKLWGTYHSEDKQTEAYKGLGNLYIADERFTMINGQTQPEFTLFLSKAMTFYTDQLH